MVCVVNALTRVSILHYGSQVALAFGVRCQIEYPVSKISMKYALLFHVLEPCSSPLVWLFSLYS